MNIKNLKSGLVRSTILAGLAAVSAPAVLAQDVDTVAEAEEDRSVQETIVVTGSRIRRDNLETAQPVTALDAETFEARAITNVADLLNEVPAFGGAIDQNGDVNSFTAGANFVNLFDLGTQRTLTLVNNRRFVSSNVPTNFGSAGGLQVDLNAIPVALVERVDIVPLSGAAVYGSDAIAGVVNVILKDDYEGFEVSGQHGFSGENDLKTYQLQTVFGTNFAEDRGNVNFVLEYNKQEGLLTTDRDFLTNSPPDFVTFSDDIDGDGTNESVARPVFGGQRVQLLSEGGAISPTTSNFLPSLGAGALADGNFYQFQPDGTLAACEPGVTPGGSAFFAYGGSCGSNFFAQVDQLRSPVDRFIAAANGHYDLTDNITFRQEFIFANSRSGELVEQGGFQSFPFSGTSAPAIMTTDNPFLTDQARGILTANGLTEFKLNRFNNDIVRSGSETENFTYRAVSALEGEFEALDREFFWDISAVYGQADVETRTIGIIDGRFANALNAKELTQADLDRVVAAGGAADAAGALSEISGFGGLGAVGLGDIVCAATIDAAAGELTGFNEQASGNGITDGDLPYLQGCVPLNLFGEGVASQDAINFINGGPAITSSDIGQTTFTANFGGQVFELPAGWINALVGFESRREDASFTPGLGASIPITRSSAFVPVTGRATTREWYAEVNVPVFSPDMNIPGLNVLEFDAAYREVESRVTAPDGSVTEDSNPALTLQGRWKPIEDLTLRGSYAEAIRSPALVELFTPQVQTFVSGDDPCDRRYVAQGDVPDTRRANCVASGITDPENFDSRISNATIIGASSGNPNLFPETSEAYSYGIVYEPSFIENLAVSIDYFKIDIVDQITDVDFESLARTCYDSSNFPNEPACATFTRGADGQVTFAQETLLNAATTQFEGITYDVSYGFDVSDAVGLVKSDLANNDFGSFDLDLNLFQRINKIEQVSADAPEVQDFKDFADPEFEATFDTRYTYGPLSAFWRVEFQGPALLDAEGDTLYEDGSGNLITETDSRLIHNLSFAYEINEGTTAQFTVDNLLDRKPNFIELARGYFATDEQFGRRFVFSVRSQF